MPRPKRWFHVSQDINEDPEFCELERQFGSKGICIFLEFLALLDRTDNRIPIKPNLKAFGTFMARKLGTQFLVFAEVLRWMMDKKWLQIETGENETLGNDSEKISKLSPSNLSKDNETQEHVGYLDENHPKQAKFSKRFGKDLEIFLKTFGKDSEKISYFYAPNWLKYRGTREHANKVSCASPSLTLKEEDKSASRRVKESPSGLSEESEKIRSFATRSTKAEKRPNLGDDPDYKINRFDEIWDMWPKKEGYNDAKAVWNHIQITADIWKKIVNDLPAWRMYGGWSAQNGRFCKRLDNWLWDQGWKDDPPRPRIIG